MDTVEDDMTIPNDIKIPMLKDFYKNLQDRKWCFTESKEKDRLVLEDFPTVGVYQFANCSECVCVCVYICDPLTQNQS